MGGGGGGGIVFSPMLYVLIDIDYLFRYLVGMGGGGEVLSLVQCLRC